MSNVKEMFANAKSDEDLALKYDAFQKAMVAAPNTARGDVQEVAVGQAKTLVKAEAPTDALTRMLGQDVISKALGADTIASITAQLEAANIQKDLSLTNPLATGYVAYDLEAPAKMLFPKDTPLRNRLPRGKGIGVAHLFKQIDGISGSQGGPARMRPGITDTTTENFGTLALNRGKKISYQGSERSIPYLQFGLSDSVPWSAQFAGEGFWDARAISQSSLLYSSMLSEEGLMLGGRGTAAGFAGALAAPAAPALAARAAAAGESPISGAGANVYVKVTAASVFGESVLSAATSVAVAAGQVVDVTVADVAGATGYNVYVGTGAADPGDAARWFALSGGSNVITIQGALPTAGKAASAVTADTSASAGDYDGILTVCAGASSGYRTRLNAGFSTANPGKEFQTAFSAMYGQNLADPEEVLLSGLDRVQLSDLLKTASSANYRIQIQNGPTGETLGNVVTGLVNEITARMVDLTVHPYMPQGNAAILTHNLPIPDSNVESCWAVKNVQDYMATQWPVIQNSYDVSTYWFGTFFCYAPKWQGIIQGIQKK